MSSAQHNRTDTPYTRTEHGKESSPQPSLVAAIFEPSVSKAKVILSSAT